MSEENPHLLRQCSDSFLSDVIAVLYLASPGLSKVMFRRKDGAGVAMSFSLTLLEDAGGILGLMRDYEAVRDE